MEFCEKVTQHSLVNWPCNLLRNRMHINFTVTVNLPLLHTAPSIYKPNATTLLLIYIAPLLNMSRISSFALIVMLFFVSSPSFCVEGCPVHELRALLRLKSTLNDTEGMLDSWKGDDCCIWNGVKCYGAPHNRQVAKLDLGNFKLRSVSGEIDFPLFELKQLTYLDLRGNYFSGEIPSQLGKLFCLRHLYLESDAFSCLYDPARFHFSCNTDDLLTSSNLNWLSNLSSLEYLSLRYVNVSDKSWGSIIGSLHKLKHLDLYSCFLSTPTIPSTLLNLSSLTFLDLRGNSFSNIPTWMEKLQSLTHLDLGFNNMSGSIPSTIVNLPRLEYLDLSYNALSGRIPPFGKNLKQYGSLSYLCLDMNKFEGTIPSSLGLHINLAFLSLNNNHLSGSLPLSFARLSSLNYLNVKGNRLNGSIPSAFMLPPSLQELYLSDNNMNGTITETFFQKSLKLEVLYLSYSGLSINISSRWIPSFQLKNLYLEKCQIGGPIPSWISTQFSLVELDLSATQLKGNIPSWLWEFEDIEVVSLSDNQLQGAFTPTSSPLRYLDLSINELSRRLPADIHRHLSNAEVLILADNKFEGQITTSIASLRNLSVLDMSNNSLTGNVPPSLCNLTHLQTLNLENNHLEGEIPKELCSLSDLQSLRIGKNSLQGVLPSCLTKFSGLQVLDVGINNLTGNIPRWIANFSSLHVLVMRSNNFSGNLPPDIGRMPQLQVLDLSSNFFSGVIPDSYLRLKAMQNSSADGRQLMIYSKSFAYSESIDLTVKSQERHYKYVLSNMAYFDLSNNRLRGSLPSEIENLKGLMYLNLSMNSLSGAIPESLGNLVKLESVDLSCNKFSGVIPWQLGNLTFLAHLNLSYNQLRGRIPQQGGQMLTFDESSFFGNPNLWGCPLQRNCSRLVPGASPLPAVGVEEKREQGFQFPWYWMCFGLSVGAGFSGMVIVLLLKFC